MGCTSSRVAPVYDPIRVKTPASESIKTSSNFRQKTPTQRSQSTSSNKVVTNADDTDLLTIPLNHKGNDPVISEARSGIKKGSQNPLSLYQTLLFLGLPRTMMNSLKLK